MPATTFDQKLIDKALKQIQAPRQVLDSDDPAFQEAVFLAAVSRHATALTPNRTKLSKGAQNLNVLRKRCSMPVTVPHDLGWLALALAQGGAEGAVQISDGPVLQLAGALKLETDPQAAFVVATDRAAATTLDAHVARFVDMRPVNDDAPTIAGGHLAAQLNIDNFAIRLYARQPAGQPAIVDISRNELANLDTIEPLLVERAAKVVDGYAAMTFASRKTTSVNDIYDNWAPGIAIPEGGRPHPAALVMSKAMSSVEPPPPRYCPKIPTSVIASGAISVAQYEPIALAKDAHERVFRSHDGVRRMGFLIADGTGTGKTNEQLGIILDNWNEGRRRHIYITEKELHFNQVAKAARMLGFRSSDIMRMSNYDLTDSLPRRDGILILTYAELRQRPVPADPKQGFPRVDQIIAWAGPDFDGVLVFDESHNLRNAIPDPSATMGDRASIQGELGVTLQDELPNARVVYASATGAIEAFNLAYMSRLRLWGEGTEFADLQQFLAMMDKGGMSAMEAVAAHLWACGLMVSRNLSFEGVEYRPITQVTTKTERDTFDRIMTALNEIARHAKLTKTDRRSTSYGQAEALAKRISEMLYGALAMPAVIRSIRTDLSRGEAAIVQVMNTYESLIDVSPTTGAVDQIEAFMAARFPVDPDETAKTKLLPSQIERNKALRDKVRPLLKNLTPLKSPIDQLFDAFGAREIAEITGRSRRRIPVGGEPLGINGADEIEERTEQDVRNDLSAFMADHKQILLFSLGAGGSSLDYHASIDAKNQRRRNHYIIQVGNQADRAVQGLGRSHRANQASAPRLNVASTDLPGQKAYRSQIMTRIAQLGAMGQGHREAATNAAFNPNDSYQGPHQNAAWRIFGTTLANGGYHNVTLEEFTNATMLAISKQNMIGGPYISVHRVLNRLARSPSSLQDRVFEIIDREIEASVTKSIIDRTYDNGPAPLPGKIEIVSTMKTLEDRVSRGSVTIHQFRGDATQKLLSFDEALEEARFHDEYAMPTYYRSRVSGLVWISVRLNDEADPDKQAFVIIMPHRAFKVDGNSSYRRNVEFIPNSTTMAQLWDAQIESVKHNETDTRFLATGCLPMIWNDITADADAPRLVIAETSDNRRILGTIINRQKAIALMIHANTGSIDKAAPHIAAIEAGNTLITDQGWMINRQLVDGIMRTMIYVRRSDVWTVNAPFKRLGIEIDTDASGNAQILLPDSPAHDQIMADLLRASAVIETTDAPDYRRLLG